MSTVCGVVQWLTVLSIVLLRLTAYRCLLAGSRVIGLHRAEGVVVVMMAYDAQSVCDGEDDQPHIVCCGCRWQSTPEATRHCARSWDVNIP